MNRNRRNCPAVIILFFILIIHPNLTSGDVLSLGGYYKNFSMAFLLPSYELNGDELNLPDLGAVNNRLRVVISLKISTRVSFDTAYDLSPRIQDPSLFTSDIYFSNIEPASYRFRDFSKIVYPESAERTGSFGLYHNLDRFLFTIKTEPADIFIGRQAIAWGSARIINPTDIIAPFAFNELDIEERWGVDAVRIRIPLGMMDELDMGYVAGRNFNLSRSAFFLKGKIYVSQTDLMLSLLGFRRHLLIGMDVARSIGGAGFWFEGAYVVPYFFNSDKGRKENNYWRASVGFDYNFSSKTYGFIEYHFSSAGKSGAENVEIFFESTAFQDGSVYLMRKHYLGLGMTNQITSLATFSGLILMNLNDSSVTISPQAEYNIAENIYISAGAYIGVGKNPEIIPYSGGSTRTLFHSEFGAYPDLLFTSFRIYF